MLAKELLSAWQLNEPGRRLVAAVSGGADSVAMLLAMIELGWSDRLTVAHFNHRWRGAESDADQQFVAELCQRYRIPARWGERKSTSEPQNGSINESINESPSHSLCHQVDLSDCRESAMLAKAQSNASEDVSRTTKSEDSARKLRYDFLIRTAYETGASYVATAHTADDRIETVLHNVLRGTGLNGIASLNVFRNLHDDLVLVRPLLNSRRADVENFLSARSQSFRIDSSNSSTLYARNFIRQKLLPLARTRYPSCDANLLSFSEVVEETLTELNETARHWLSQVEDWRTRPSTGHPNLASGMQIPGHWKSDHYWVVPAERLAPVIWPVLREALRLVWLDRQWPLGEMSRQHWLRLRELLFSGEPCSSSLAVRTVLPGQLQVETWDKFVAIGRPPIPAAAEQGS